MMNGDGLVAPIILGNLGRIQSLPRSTLNNIYPVNNYLSYFFLISNNACCSGIKNSDDILIQAPMSRSVGENNRVRGYYSKHSLKYMDRLECFRRNPAIFFNGLIADLAVHMTIESSLYRLYLMRIVSNGFPDWRSNFNFGHY